MIPSLTTLLALSSLMFATPVVAAPQPETPETIDGRQIIEHIEKLLWGKTSRGRYTMRISTPRWQRTLEIDMWMRRPDKTFIRIRAPAKEAGTASLRIGDEMWNYIPKVERVIKIPPSMMLQPWMGSDFANDDLVKESSVIRDYQHRVIGREQQGDDAVLVVEALPRENAAVVWGKLVYRVRERDLMPLKQDYFSERGERIKEMTFSQVKQMGGRLLPTHWEMRSLRKPGNVTVVELQDIVFDKPIADAIFTLRNLRNPE